MAKVLTTTATLAATLLTSCGSSAKAIAASEAALTNFHELFNQGKFDDIWNQAGSEFQKAISKPKYDELINAVHRKLGKVVSVSNERWNVRSFNLRTSVVLSLDTKLDEGHATETFTFAFDGTKAIVLGWNIQSFDLINYQVTTYV